MEARDVRSPNQAVDNVLVRAVKKWLMHPARVASVEALSENFRLITLQGEAIKAAEWVAGQQIQIAVGTGLVGRTYTPIDWDRNHGVTRFVVFLHGSGPGCAWARSIQPGSQHDLFGPTRSLKLAPDQPFTLFADETAFGLGLALQNATPDGTRCRFCFEVSNLRESRDVLAALGLHGANLMERTSGYEHLTEAARTIAMSTEAHHQIVLSGNARSIQQVRKAMATHSVRRSNIIVRPYWSPGRTGMS